MPPLELLPHVDISFWVIQTVAMLVTAALIPKLEVSGPIPALAMVIALTVVNAKLWDAALFFNVPDHFSVQLLTLWVANGFIFWILVKLLPGIEVEGFLPALVAPIVFTISTLLIDKYGRNIDWTHVWNVVVHLVDSVKNEVSSAATSPSPTPPVR